MHAGLTLITAREVKAQCERTADKLSAEYSVITGARLFFFLYSAWVSCFFSSSLSEYLFIPDYILTHPLCDHMLSVCIYLQVISGSNLPVPGSGKALDPFVRVEIHGIPSDSYKKNTHTVKSCKYVSGAGLKVSSICHLQQCLI